MLVEDFNAVLLREVGEHAAVLRIGEAVFEDFFGRATGGLRAAPIDVNQAAAGHAAEPTTGFDDEYATAFTSSGDGGGDTRGVAGVDADIGDERARFSAPERQESAERDKTTRPNEIATVKVGIHRERAFFTVGWVRGIKTSWSPRGESCAAWCS